MEAKDDNDVKNFVAFLKSVDLILSDSSTRSTKYGVQIAGNINTNE